MKRPAIALCLGALAVTGTASAEPREDRVDRYLHVFDHMRNRSLAVLEQQFNAAPGKGSAKQEITAEERAKGRFANVAARTPALGQENALNAIDRASAAVKTSIQGAEAGLSLAPIALFGRDDLPHQINVTFAALKDTKTRFGLAYSYEPPWTPASVEDLGLETCDLAAAKKELGKNIDAARSALLRVCEGVVDPLVAPIQESEKNEVKITAAFACGLPIPQAIQDAKPIKDQLLAMTASMGIQSVTALIDDEKKLLEGGDELEGARGAEAKRFAFEERLAGVDSSLKVLEEVKAPHAYECYDKKKLDAAKKVATWAHTRHRFGFGGTADLFPVLLGFAPDGKELSRGQLQRWQTRVEYAMVSGSASVSVGAGAGALRDTFGDPFRAFLSPAFSAAVVLGSLTREPLKDPLGRLLLVDGELPPRLSLGLDIAFDLALARPASQVSVLEKLNGTLFLDFLYTDKLAFRLGVPVSGETKVRAADPKANPPVTEKRDLQWTFPVALTTVIKM